MSTAAIIVNVVLTSFIGITGTLGNILVIFAFIKFRTLRTITNIFVLQLAINDLVKASIILTIKSVNQASNATSNGRVLCQISGFLRTIGSCQSALLLAAIAIVRYFKVVKPQYFEKLFSFKKTLIYCTSILSITVVFALFPIIGIGEYKLSQAHGVCFVNWEKQNIVFRIIYYIFNVGVTIPVLIFCYWKIFQKIHIHSLTVTPKLCRKERRNSVEIKVETNDIMLKSYSKKSNDEMEVKEVNGHNTLERKATCNGEVNSESTASKGHNTFSIEARSLSGSIGMTRRGNNTQVRRVRSQSTGNTLAECQIEVKGENVGSLPVKIENNSIENGHNQNRVDFHAVNGLTCKKPAPNSHRKEKIDFGKQDGAEYNMKRETSETSLVKKKQKSEMELEISKVMFTVFVAYTICWIPAVVANIFKLTKLEIPKDVLLFVPTLVDLNVFFNPLIYGIGSKQFRIAFLAQIRQWDRKTACSYDI